MRRTALFCILLGACASGPHGPLVPAHAPAAALVAEGDRLRRAGKEAEAEAAYLRALEVDPGSVRGHLGLQEILLARGLDLEVRRAYRERGDRFLAGRLEATPDRQKKVFEDAGEPWRSVGLAMAEAGEGSPGGARRHYRRATDLDPGLLLGRVGLGNALLAGGRLGQAAAEYEAAAWTDPEHPAPHLGLSLVAERRGDLAAAFEHAVEAFRRAPAEEALAARVHEVAQRSSGRYLARASRVLGESEAAAALLHAARLAKEAGDEGVHRDLLSRARAKGATEAEARAEPAPPPPSVRAFVRAFARGVTARYRHYVASGERESFREFHVWARGLYERTTGRALGPPGRALDYAFVGRLVDPSEESDEPLVRDLRREGLLLVLGQRAGGPPEALLAEIVRFEPPAGVRVRQAGVSRAVAWIGTRHLSGFQEWAGAGDLAGLALPRLVLVDLHAVARWEGEIERRRARQMPWRQRILGAEALPDLPLDAISDPAGVADRLYLDAPLDMAGEVLKHEEAHLVDADRHLPVLSHPLRNLELALRGGFSAEEILALLERNAQLTAIAEGPTPRSALATCCAALGRGGPHGDGYEEIVAAFVEEIADRPELYPEIDGTRVIAQQLHRLPDDRIRAIARAIATRWGVAP